MFFIAGISARVKPAGHGSCSCPACGRQVQLSASKKYSVVTLFFVPVVPFGSSYLVTCSACASVLLLDKKKGRQLERNPDTILLPEDLVLLQNNAGLSCTHCGARMSQDHHFCPNCGQKA